MRPVRLALVAPPEAAAGLRQALWEEMLVGATALTLVADGVHLDDALSRATAQLGAPSVRAVRDMAYAAMRRFGLLQAIATRLNARSPQPRLAALQTWALSELIEAMRPAPIVIDQAVRAAHALGIGAGAGGFINATLRRWLREREALMAAVAGDPVARWNHPAWWIDRLRQDYPDQWQPILEASHRRAPMILRVNGRAARRGQTPLVSDTGVDLLAALDAQGIGHRRQGPSTLVLDRPLPVDQIPGFAQGWFTVQDAGAQLAVPMLDPRDGEHVLDACAAPGGKTTHLLQWAACEVTAIDPDTRRLERVTQNLEREGLHARVMAGDAGDPSGWWDGRPFDRILLDAPCSASGIVRRHPDVPWHRQRRDIATLASTQQRLLRALWPTLKPGGTLLYITCSLFHQEGSGVIGAVAATGAALPGLDRVAMTHPFAAAAPVATGDRSAQAGSIQLLPSRQGFPEHDGYFFALLKKTR